MARGMGFSSVVLFLLVFAVALGVFVVLRHGVSARDEPTKAEVFVARRLRHLAIPMSAREMKSPLSMSPQTVKAGMEHFADHCATCHDNDGSGDTEIGKGLYPKPPDMRTEETQALSDGELFYIIENGIRFTGMPGWGKGHSDKSDKPDSSGTDATDSDSSHDTWALVQFIRHLPKLTDDEKSQMQALNPKSPEEWEQEQQTREFLKGGETPAAPVEPAGHQHEHGTPKPTPPPPPKPK
jgi:hypothetical protein